VQRHQPVGGQLPFEVDLQPAGRQKRKAPAATKAGEVAFVDFRQIREVESDRTHRAHE
jgi:hypothetical protein